MHKDIDHFYEKLMDIHAFPFQLLDEQAWKEKTDSLKKAIDHPMSRRDFFLELSCFNAYLDLHSSVHPSYKDMNQMRAKTAKIDFPDFTEKGDAIFFKNKDAQECRLVSVYGKTIAEIRKNYASRTSCVEPIHNPNFLDILKGFCTNRMIVTDSLEYVCQDSLGNTHSCFFTLKQTDKQNGKKSKSKTEPNKTGTKLTIDTIKSAAVLEVNTFMPSNMMDFRDSVFTYFRRLDTFKIRRLYIDITSNSGGAIGLTTFLASFLLDQEEELYAGTWTSKASKARDLQRLDILLRNGEHGDYTQNALKFNPKSYKPKFMGEVYIVESRNSFSAAAIFTSLVQFYSPRCKVIGEAGEIKAFYADPLLVVLPKSKFVITISSMFGKFVGKDKDQGVAPDIPYRIYDTRKSLTLSQLEQIVENYEKQKTQYQK